MTARLTPEQKQQIVQTALAIQQQSPGWRPHQLYNAALDHLGIMRAPLKGPSMVPSWFTDQMVEGEALPAPAPVPAVAAAAAATPQAQLSDALQATFIEALRTPAGQAAIQEALRPILGQALITLGESVLAGQQK